MGKYRKKREIMSLDLTPLIDVVFLSFDFSLWFQLLLINMERLI